MELNPKFKLSYNEMCKFQQDCENAVTRCPRYLGYWGFSIDSIYDGHVSAKDLVERWLECYTLWDGGYHLYLSKETLGIIKKYKEHKKKLKSIKKEFSLEKYSTVDPNVLLTQGAGGDAGAAIAYCVKMLKNKS